MGLFEQNPLVFVATVVGIVEGWSLLKRRLTAARRRQREIV